MQIRNIILAFALTLITVDARPTHYDQSGAPLSNGNSGSDGQNSGHNYGLYNSQNPDHKGDKVDDCDKDNNDQPSPRPHPVQRPTQPPNNGGVPPIYHPKDGRNGGNGQPPYNNVDSTDKGPNQKPSAPNNPYPGHNGGYGDQDLPPTNPPKVVGNGAHGQPPIYHPKDGRNGGNGQPPYNNVDSTHKGPNQKPSPPNSQYPGLDDDCDTTKTHPPHSNPGANSDPSKPYSATDPSSKPRTPPQGY